MASKKILQIRRALLAALDDFSGPQDLDTIMCHHAVRATGDDVALVRREWLGLQDAGYLVAVSGYQGGVCKLADTVRETIAKTGQPPKDEYLWGYTAL